MSCRDPGRRSELTRPRAESRVIAWGRSAWRTHIFLSLCRKRGRDSQQHPHMGHVPLIDTSVSDPNRSDANPQIPYSWGSTCSSAGVLMSKSSFQTAQISINKKGSNTEMWWGREGAKLFHQSPLVSAFPALIPLGHVFINCWHPDLCQTSARPPAHSNASERFRMVPDVWLPADSTSRWDNCFLHVDASCRFLACLVSMELN